jgi:hypothetical protein
LLLNVTSKHFILFSRVRGRVSGIFFSVGRKANESDHRKTKKEAVDTGERAWKAIGERLQGPCYLSRDDHDRKIRSRKQRTHIGKYSFVNRTIKLWNNQPAEALGTFPCKPHIFRKRVRKLNISEVK